MCYSDEKQPRPTTANDAGEVVDVPNRYWFLAFVGNNTEKSVRTRLAQQGYESYVASQQETHRWRNGRYKTVERVVIPALVFCHATEKERREIVALPYVKCFLTNRAGKPNEFGIHPLAVIPDSEMRMLQFMLHNADRPVEFAAPDLAMGDAVRVIRGSLKGLEGQVCRLPERPTAMENTSGVADKTPGATDTKSVSDAPTRYIGIRIGPLGCALLSLPLDDLEKIS